MQKIVVCMIRSPDDSNLILHFQRRDNHKWTTVCGHVEDNEDIHNAALRELEEEVGIPRTQVKTCDLVADEIYPGLDDTNHIFLFNIEFHDDPTFNATKDVDSEPIPGTLTYLDPIKTDKPLHVPKGRNLLIQYLSDLDKSELEKGQNGDWQKEGYTLHHKVGKDFGDSKYHTIIANDKEGNFAGHFDFDHVVDPNIGEHINVRSATVSPLHRRVGLANAAYKYIENMTGAKIASSPGNQSDDAKVLWAQPNRPFGKSELVKTPEPLDEDHDPNSWEVDSPKKNYVHAKTTQLGPQLYHHVMHPKPFQGNQNKITHHYLSTNGNPDHPVADLIVEHKSFGPQVTQSVVDPGFRGKGYGKKLYLAALQHHGSLESDDTISQNAQNIWRSIAKHPEVDAQLDDYPGNSTHRAKWIGKSEDFDPSHILAHWNNTNTTGTLPKHASTTVNKFGSYSLRDVDPNMVNVSNDSDEVDPDWVNEYSSMSTEPPPIILHPLTDGRFRIIDGKHRTLVARGKKIPIKAYIGKSSLEKGAPQRLMPYKPQKYQIAGTKPNRIIERGRENSERGIIEQWQHGDTRRARDKIPILTGSGRERALRKLGGKTKMRINPDNGEMEFLLHRGHSPDEIFGQSHVNTSSSWTPNYETAHAFSSYYKVNAKGEKPGGNITSAWFPESDIHHIPNQVGPWLNEKGIYSHTKLSPIYRNEHEVIIRPGHKGQLANPQEIPSLHDIENIKTPDDAINYRAQSTLEGLPAVNRELQRRRIGKSEKDLNLNGSSMKKSKKYFSKKLEKSASYKPGPWEKKQYIAPHQEVKDIKDMGHSDIHVKIGDKGEEIAGSTPPKKIRDKSFTGKPSKLANSEKSPKSSYFKTRMEKTTKSPSKHLSREFLRNTLKDNNISYANGGKKQTEYHQPEMEHMLQQKDSEHADKWADDQWDKWIESQVKKAMDLTQEDLIKGKNAREQKKKVWGSNPTPSENSPMRQKMMDRIVDYAERRYKMPVERAPGKPNASGKIIDKPELSQDSIQHIGNPASLIHELAHIENQKQTGMPPDQFQAWMDKRWGAINKEHGYKQQSREQEEYEAHGAENKMRRQFGMPPHTRPTKETKPGRLFAADRPDKQIAMDVPHKGGTRRITGLSSNLDARRPQFEARQAGIQEFSPQQGWTDSAQPDALINRRAAGDVEGAAKLRRQKYFKDRHDKISKKNKMARPEDDVA